MLGRLRNLLNGPKAAGIGRVGCRRTIAIDGIAVATARIVVGHHVVGIDVAQVEMLFRTTHQVPKQRRVVVGVIHHFQVGASSLLLRIAQILSRRNILHPVVPSFGDEFPQVRVQVLRTAAHADGRLRGTRIGKSQEIARLRTAPKTVIASVIIDKQRRGQTSERAVEEGIVVNDKSLDVVHIFFVGVKHHPVRVDDGMNIPYFKILINRRANLGNHRIQVCQHLLVESILVKL